MTDLRKAAEMALEFVDWLCGDDHSVKPKNKALDVREALRQALAQPEQEPVAWLDPNENRSDEAFRFGKQEHHTIPLYAAPPKREWVGLTDGDFKHFSFYAPWEIVQEIEAKLKEKNNA